MRASLQTLVLATLLAACSGANPPHTGAVRQDDSAPRTGQRADTLLALIVAPSGTRIHRTVSRVELYQTRQDPWKRLGRREQRDVESQDLAVLAEAWCRLEFDGEIYVGHVVSWYLLERNRLDAMDHYGFGERCAVRNVYRPATGEDRVAVEKRIAQRRAEVQLDPASSFELYERGLALVEAGRALEARALLEQADQRIPGATSFARERLVRALQR